MAKALQGGIHSRGCPVLTIGIRRLLQQWRDTAVQGRRKGAHSEEFKSLVEGVLQEHGFALQRSAKLSLDDFLRLLARFNEKGIHFAS